MTATGLIYKAALKTKEIALANGRKIIYTDIEAEPVNDFSCWLCGTMMDTAKGMNFGSAQRFGVPLRKAIKPTFTDANLAAAPHSKSICKACAFCLSYKELRNYSILVTFDSLRHPARGEWRQILLEPPQPPFVACIALSGQRWLHIRAKVAFSREYYPVQVEDTLFYVDRPLLADLSQLVDEMYVTFTKEEIKTGEYQPHRVQAFGIQRFSEIEEELAPYRGTRIFNLAVITAQRKETVREP